MHTLRAPGPHVYAKLTLTPTTEGGRHTPVFSGYRTQFRYLGRDNDVSVTLLECDRLLPGESAHVHLTFSRPELQVDRLRENTSFGLAEGARQVAIGTIQSVLAGDLAAISLMLSRGNRQASRDGRRSWKPGQSVQADEQKDRILPRSKRRDKCH